MSLDEVIALTHTFGFFFIPCMGDFSSICQGNLGSNI